MIHLRSVKVTYIPLLPDVVFIAELFTYRSTLAMVFGKEHALEHLSKTPIAFVGTLIESIPGISTRSMPPTNHYKLRFQQIRPLRGDVSATEFSYHQLGASCFQQRPMLNPEGVAALMGKSHDEGVKEPTVGVTYLACSTDGDHVHSLVELDNTTMEQLLHSSKIPLGWTKRSDGRLESPWQHSHAKNIRWYDNPRYASVEKCAKTGRPSLITGDDISLSCEPIRPAHVKEYQNPDGDGRSIVFLFRCRFSSLFSSDRSVQVDCDQQ
jgi:hypothetical protein